MFCSCHVDVYVQWICSGGFISSFTSVEKILSRAEMHARICILINSVYINIMLKITTAAFINAYKACSMSRALGALILNAWKWLEFIF